MKKLFPDKNKRKPIGRGASLLIIGLIAASPFILIFPSSAAAPIISPNFCKHLHLTGSGALPDVNIQTTCASLVGGLSVNEVNMMLDSDFLDQLKANVNKNTEVIVDSFVTFCTDAQNQGKLGSTSFGSCKSQANPFHAFLNSLDQSRVTQWPKTSLHFYATHGVFGSNKTETDFFNAADKDSGLNGIFGSNKTLEDYLWNYTHGIPNS